MKIIPNYKLQILIILSSDHITNTSQPNERPVPLLQGKINYPAVNEIFFDQQRFD